MNGTPPVNRPLSQYQSKMSKTIADSVPELPTAVTDLISQYALYDFTLAHQTPDLGTDGSLIENVRNQKIMSTIEKALTSSSTDCDPATKAKIFINAADNFNYFHSEDSYLKIAIQNIQRKGLQINLDDVALTCFDTYGFWDLNLSGISAQRIEFTGALMLRINFSGADLTGAKFKDSNLINVDLSHATITDAIFTDVEFAGTKADELTGNQSGISQHVVKLNETQKIENATISTTRIAIDGAFSALPDTAQFTLPEITSTTTFA